MKIKEIGLVIGMLIVFSGCQTVTMKESYDSPRPPVSSSSNEIDATINCRNSKYADLEVINKTNSVLVIQWDMSSFNPMNGNAQRLAPDGTKFSEIWNSQY